MGLLFINGLYVSSLDLGDWTEFGDVVLWTLEDSEVAETQFKDSGPARARPVTRPGGR